MPTPEEIVSEVVAERGVGNGSAHEYDTMNILASKVADMIDPAAHLEPFYVTFGVQYRKNDPDSQHPISPDVIDAGGYVLILAPDEETARFAAFGIFGQQFSFIYRANDFDLDHPQAKRWYPLGEVGRITINFPIMKGPTR